MPPHTPAHIIILIGIILIAAPATAIDITAGSASATIPVISQGDSVFIHGVATGHPQVGLQVWVLGNNYARVSTITVADNNVYEIEITKADTRTMSPGQYYVLVQHPMMNGQFDIVYNSGTGQVINRQMGSSGTSIFQLTGAGSLQGPAAAAALERAVADQNIDDLFTTVKFTISNPDAVIDPIDERYVGDRFTLTGTTNLAAGDDILVSVTAAAFRPTVKGQPNEFAGSSGIVKVKAGATGNYWSYDVNTAGWAPGEYIVIISSVLQNARDSTTFVLAERSAAPHTQHQVSQTANPPATPAAVTTILPATAPLPTTQQAAAGLIVIPALAFIALRKRI